MLSGVYKIENIRDGKFYIGSSMDINGRWKVHVRQLENNSHYSKHLQNAWNKYGKECFKFSILEIVASNDLLNVEQQYLDLHKPFKTRGYNTLPTAGSPKGYKFTKKHKLNIAKAHFGKKHTAKTKKKMSIARQKRVISEETRKKLSRAHTGKTGFRHTEETKNKMSKAKKKALSDTDVIFIKYLYRTTPIVQKDLARLFDVCMKTIYKALHRKKL